MYKKFKDYNPDQLLLFPPSLRDWLPPDHPVHFINEVVEELDLSAIMNDYKDPRGHPPYNPVMMVKILVYGYWRGIRSSRKLERALYEDIGFRFLSANQQPDFWTIAAFRRRHHKALGDLLAQTVKLAMKAGLVRLNHVAVDGTKIKANASKHSSMSYGRMVKEEERLRAEIEEYLKEVEETDAAEDREFGKRRRGYELPDHLKTPKQRLEAIRRAKAELEKEARQKASEEQRQKDGEERQKNSRKGKGLAKETRAVPPERAQYNFTDPDSRIMLGPDKAFIQGYNAQIAVDAETQIIVAADLTNQASDRPHLPGLIEQARQNTGKLPAEVSADAGYFSEKNVKLLSSQGIEVFIPPDKVKHSEWRNPPQLRGRLPKNITVAGLMRRKLKTKRGRARYKLRQLSVEPVLGQIKEVRGLRQFCLRGLSKVRSSWLFECAVHNLIKLFNHGIRLAACPVAA